MSGELLTFTEFAKLIGVSPQRVGQAAKAGKISVELVDGKKRVDPELAKKEWAENRNYSTPRNPSGKKKVAKKKAVKTKTKVVTKKEKIEVPTFEGMTTADAERKEKVYKARLSELKYLEQAGNLLRKDEVEREAFESARKVRDSIASVPARFSHELAAITDPHKLEIELNKILTKALEQGMRNAKTKEKDE